MRQAPAPAGILYAKGAGEILPHQRANAAGATAPSRILLAAATAADRDHAQRTKGTTIGERA